jgi:hypothetical protein
MSEELWINDGTDGRPAPKRRDGRHIGCPLTWFKAVLPVVRGKNELVVALAIYRLHVVRKSRTIAVSNVSLLAELGISRHTKYRALRRLAAAKIITVAACNGRAIEITLARSLVR